MLSAGFLTIVSSLLVVPATSAAPAGTDDILTCIVPPAPAVNSVKDFSAKGDGKADDTAAIEAAVKAAGAVYFPAGDYRITRTIRIDLDAVGRTSLIGCGEATIVMAGPGPAFHFVGTHEATADPEGVRENVWRLQRMPLVSGIEILGAHAEAVGIRLEKTMQATLTNLLIRRCKIGVSLSGRNRNLLIDHCHIYHNTDIGIDFDRVNLHQVIVSNSHISYNRLAGIRLVGGEMRNFQIVGNDIEYNHDPKVEDCVDVLIDMRPEGSTFREGTIVGNTIQARPSPNGANIRFLGGKNLCTGGLLAITGNLIGSQTHNVHLKDCRGVTVSGNSIYSAAGHSLWFEDSANIVASGNSIDWNPDFKTKQLIDGILIDRCKGMILSDTIIEDSFAGAEQSGGAVEIRDSSDVSVSSCQVLNFRFRGIALSGAVRCRVAGCSVIERRRAPPQEGTSIVVRGGRDNLIAGNIVNRSGLSVDAAAATVRGNIDAIGTD
ncbi:MAG: right-handed parallel beta-helix repeat-containing protein [Sedimentisphaerales bacterium]|nr:right-handed parallel beta-helix repeat-containing protein [Sedimentisphaerales bacterium]